MCLEFCEKVVENEEVYIEGNVAIDSLKTENQGVPENAKRFRNSPSGS